MYLHENKDEFKKLINETAHYFEMSEHDVEKDYWCYYCITRLSQIDSVVFKGSSLYFSLLENKERYPDDVDIVMLSQVGSTTKENIAKSRKLFAELFDGIRLSPSLENQAQWSWFFYDSVINKYRNHFVVECFVNSEFNNVDYDSYEISSLIYKYLVANSSFEKCIKYNLEGLKVKGINLQRMFIEKIFTIPYAASEYYKKPSWKKYEIIRDLIIFMKLPQIKLFIENEQQFVDMCKIKLEEDRIIQQERFGADINKIQIVDNNFFNTICDDEHRYEYYKYNEFRRYNKFEEFEEFVKLCDKLLCIFDTYNKELFNSVYSGC